MRINPINPLRSGRADRPWGGAQQSGLAGSQARVKSRAADPSQLLRQTAQAATRIRETFSGAAPSASVDEPSLQPLYRWQARYVTRNVFERRDVLETQDVYEDRAITERRAVYGERDVYDERPVHETRELHDTRDVFEVRDLYETRDVTEIRDVYEQRDVFETRTVYSSRPIYDEQEVLETHVYGSRDIDGFARTRAAGIDIGADFAVTVGDDETAVLKFAGNRKISVKAAGTSKEIAFDGSAGSFSEGLLEALNSVAGLSAEYTKDGRLHLKTSNGRSLSIAEVPNGRRDRTESPLDELGLAAGTTRASIVAHRRVETGSEQVAIGVGQVKVGFENVKVGTEEVTVGTQQVKVGTENVKSGIERYLVGTEVVQIGTERVKTGTERYLAGTELVTVGTERVRVGAKQVVVGSESVKVGSSRVIAGYERTFAGFRQSSASSGDALSYRQFNAATRASARSIALLFADAPTPVVAAGALLSMHGATDW